VFGDTLSAPLEDQVDALDAVAALFPDLDQGRVGINGWSYGGALAAIAVIRRPDVFHAAVSGAATHDARLYDTYWRERFLGPPQQNPEAYERSSTMTEAARLTRPLLLIHGMADDNVVVAHTLRMSAALLAAGRPHQVLPLSGSTHMPADLGSQLLGHEFAFLADALGVARRDAELPGRDRIPDQPGSGIRALTSRRRFRLAPAGCPRRQRDRTSRIAPGAPGDPNGSAPGCR
jgi:dipeptidyl-peptidase-4